MQRRFGFRGPCVECGTIGRRELAACGGERLAGRGRVGLREGDLCEQQAAADDGFSRGTVSQGGLCRVPGSVRIAARQANAAVEQQQIRLAHARPLSSRERLADERCRGRGVAQGVEADRETARGGRTGRCVS